MTRILIDTFYIVDQPSVYKMVIVVSVRRYKFVVFLQLYFAIFVILIVRLRGYLSLCHVARFRMEEINLFLLYTVYGFPVNVCIIL
jgi:hypothetical protein